MGAIFRGLQMALQTAEKLASELCRDFRAVCLLLGIPKRACRGVLIEENAHWDRGPALHLQANCSSPGTIDSESTRASAPGHSFCAFQLGRRRLPHRASQDQVPKSHGTLMGPPWDFDGTSERLTVLEMGLYPKKSHKKDISAPTEGNCPALALSHGVGSLPK